MSLFTSIKPDSYVDSYENPDDFCGFLLGKLSTEIINVDLFITGGKVGETGVAPVIYIVGPEYAVRWLRYLVTQEIQRTETAYSE